MPIMIIQALKSQIVTISQLTKRNQTATKGHSQTRP